MYIWYCCYSVMFICCESEQHRTLRPDTSNEYTQSMFYGKIEKIIPELSKSLP